MKITYKDKVELLEKEIKRAKEDLPIFRAVLKDVRAVRWIAMSPEIRNHYE